MHNNLYSHINSENIRRYLYFATSASTKSITRILSNKEKVNDPEIKFKQLSVSRLLE